MPRRRPNIVIIVMDTQRAANMGCYGCAKATTPNIDALAAEGVACLNNISSGSWTLPSHASLWTGKYAASHGATIRHEYLEPGLITLPGVLRELGYETRAICRNNWASRPAGNHRGFRRFTTGAEFLELRRQYAPRVQGLLRERGEEFDSGSLFELTLAIDWIEELRGRKRPFMLFVNCLDPHLRCWPPQPFRRRFLPGGADDREAGAVVQSPAKITTGAVRMSPRDWRIIKSLNDGETATLDARLGMLFDHLRSSGLMDDTFLIVASDHGDELGEHPPLAAHVLNVYDTVLRVPLVMRLPAVLQRGKKIRRLTQTLDIFPTLMEVLGVRRRAILNELQGISILNHLRGRDGRTWALAEHDRPMQVFERYLTQYPHADLRWADRTLKAWYRGRFKYIWSSRGEDELYDLAADAGEKRNLAGRDPRRVARMRREMEEKLLSLPRRNFPDYLNESPEKRGKDVTKDRLRAWGIYNDRLTPGGKPRFPEGTTGL